MNYLTQFRVLWLAGRFGGGKTALAVHLAYELCRLNHADSICSNVPFLEFGEPTAVLQKEELSQLTDCVMLLDESWLMLGQGVPPKQVTAWLAYLRKNNQYMLLPSVMPLNRQLSMFVVERRFNFASFGVPLWWYQWRLTTGAVAKKNTDTRGQIYWWYPQRVFSLYDHYHKPSESYYYYATTSEGEAG